MGFLSQEALISLGFEHVGADVRVSDRASIHDASRIRIGDRSRIDDFCVLSGGVAIGCNVHVAVFCNIAGGEPGVTIHDFSGLAYGCTVFTQSDDYTGRALTNPTVPAEFKRVSRSPVVIEKHCIVGAGSIVFPGVVLREGTAVGAMSLATKSTEPWSVYFGIPAKRIKARRRDLLELEKRYLDELRGGGGAEHHLPAGH